MSASTSFSLNALSMPRVREFRMQLARAATYSGSFRLPLVASDDSKIPCPKYLISCQQWVLLNSMRSASVFASQCRSVARYSAICTLNSYREAR